MLRLHNDGGVFCTEEVAGVVDVGDKFKVLLLDLRDRAGAHDARVRQHQIKAAEQLNGLADHRRDALLVIDVDCDGDGALAEFLCDLLCQRLVHVGDHDGRALVVKLLRDALAEALRSAGHDADLAGHSARSGGAVADIFLGDLTPSCHIYRHFLISFPYTSAYAGMRAPSLSYDAGCRS